MGIYRSLGGTVRIKLISADIFGAISGLNRMGIVMENVRAEEELCVHFSVRQKNVRKLLAYARKRGDVLEVTGKEGLYWMIRRLFFRPVVILGMLFLLLVGIYLPGRVLFVSVEGNQSVPEHRILEAAQMCGVCFGASRREVRSEHVKNEILSKLPELQWAGVNTYGCRAVITVRERPAAEGERGALPVSSIVAVRDCVVSSVTVTRGNSLCRPGQAVKKGQVLISCYMDCGRFVTAAPAEGEVMGITTRELDVVTPSSCRTRDKVHTVSRKYSLRYGKKRINFYKGSGISGAGCVKMYSEYVLTLPGGYELPVALIQETVLEADLQKSSVEPDSGAMLSEFAQQYLKKQMVAGSISSKVEQTEASDGVILFRGRYTCMEMIGRRREEMIGESNGKTDGTDRERGSGG